MRFVIMHKNDPSTEASKPPPMDVVQKMGAFIGEHAKAGRFLDGAGLGASQTRSRLTFRGGKSTVKHGPYAGERELPAAVHQIEVETREQGLEWAERYGRILGDGEIELGKVTEPWDIGIMSAPENPPLHFLLIEKADATSEGTGRSAEEKAGIAALKDEMNTAGVLQKSLRLEPSKKAKRLRFTNNEMRVLDGPFAESKELIGGFAVMEMPGFDEVIAMSRTYAAILGGNLEIDIRQVDASEGA